jgi:hypothetical protein
MPISYVIDRPRGLVRTICTGEVRFPDVLSHFDQLQKDPDRPWRLDVLLDFSGLLTTPGVPEVRGVAYRIQHVIDFGFERCALVAEQGPEIETARVFREVCGTRFSRVEVFPDAPSAEQWLAQ